MNRRENRKFPGKIRIKGNRYFRCLTLFAYDFVLTLVLTRGRHGLENSDFDEIHFGYRLKLLY